MGILINIDISKIIFKKYKYILVQYLLKGIVQNW